ncbi:MAG: TetR/AcrR family transcriptional regulator [Chloroflexota bacterium]
MAEKPENTPQKRKRRDRTEEILQAATRLFSEQGFRGTSLATIAEEVGLTQPGLLHYYPSKVKLLQGVLEYREKEDVKKYFEIVESENPDFKIIISVLQELVADNQEKPALIRLFTVLVAESIRPDHPSHDYFVDRYNYARQVYGDIFSRLQSEGQIKPDVDPDQIAILIMAIMDGLQIQWLLDPENVDLTKSFKVFAEIISNYLKSE